MIRSLVVGLALVAGLGCSEPMAPSEEPVVVDEVSEAWQPRWNRVPGYSLVSASPVCKKNAVGSCGGHGKSGLGGLKSSF